MDTDIAELTGQLQQRVKSGEPGLFFISCPGLTADGKLCGNHLDSALFIPGDHTICPVCGHDIGCKISQATISVS